MPRLLFLLALACAPLNQATMSDSCRYAYNACLNHCPRAAPAPVGDTQPAIPRDQQIDVAACTQDCNTRAQSCK